MEFIASGSRFQENKTVDWRGMKCEGGTTEVVEDGSSAVSRI